MVTCKILNDLHPSKIHEGLELFLCVCVRETGYDGKTTSTEMCLTGFRVDRSQTKGMFSRKEEPIQVLRNYWNGVIMTTANIGSIETWKIDELLRDGKVKFGNEFNRYRIKMIERPDDASKDMVEFVQAMRF